MPGTPSLVIERHAHAASVLWLRRELAVAAPHYSLIDLARLDEQLEANLDGLLLAGDVGWQVCLDELRWREPGEAFTAAVLALHSDSDARLDTVLRSVGDAADLQSAVVSACGWLPWDRIEQRMRRYWNNDDPQRRLLALAAAAVHRHDAGPIIAAGCADAYRPLRMRALRAVGELARHDLLPLAVDALHDVDPLCRLSAACSVARLTDNADAVGIVCDWIENEPVALAPAGLLQQAMHLAVRRMAPPQAMCWINQLGADPATHRVAVIAAGQLGLVDAIAWLLQVMALETDARIAGEAFSTITGLDLTADELQTDPPDGFDAGPTDVPDDERVDLDPDENLPWPHVASVARWWTQHGAHFSIGRRYMLGQPIEVQWIQQVLRDGLQRQRIAAAWELAVRDPQAPLFNVRAPAARQQRQLGLTRRR